MLYEVITLIGFGDISMFYRPAEVGMRLGSGADDDRGFHQQIVTPPDDGNSVTEIAFDADRSQFVA